MFVNIFFLLNCMKIPRSSVHCHMPFLPHDFFYPLQHNLDLLSFPIYIYSFSVSGRGCVVVSLETLLPLCSANCWVCRSFFEFYSYGIFCAVLFSFVVFSIYLQGRIGGRGA